MINGVNYAWIPVPSNNPVAPASDTAEALPALTAEDVLPIDSEFDFHCGIVESEELHVDLYTCARFCMSLQSSNMKLPSVYPDK